MLRLLVVISTGFSRTSFPRRILVDRGSGIDFRVEFGVSRLSSNAFRVLVFPEGFWWIGARVLISLRILVYRGYEVLFFAY